MYSSIKLCHTILGSHSQDSVPEWFSPVEDYVENLGYLQRGRWSQSSYDQSPLCSWLLQPAQRCSCPLSSQRCPCRHLRKVHCQQPTQQEQSRWGESSWWIYYGIPLNGKEVFLFRDISHVKCFMSVKSKLGKRPSFPKLKVTFNRNKHTNKMSIEWLKKNLSRVDSWKVHKGISFEFN